MIHSPRPTEADTVVTRKRHTSNVLRKLPTPLLHNTLWMGIGQSARLGVQLAYYALLAKTLGPAAFGEFATITALLNILATFAAWGGGYVIIMRHATGTARTNATLGNTLILLPITSLLCITLSLTFFYHFFPNYTLVSVLLLSVADLFFLPLVVICAATFQGLEHLMGTAMLNIMLRVSRLIVVILYSLHDVPHSLAEWSQLYLIATMIAGVLSLAYVVHSIGPPSVQLSQVRGQIVEGWHFSNFLSGSMIYNDSDKLVVSRFSADIVTGAYAIASRLTYMSLLPVRSFLAAASAPLFRRGALGNLGAVVFGKRVMPYSTSFGAIVSVGLYFCAPVVPYVMGPDYSSVVSMIRFMAFIPFLQSMSLVLGDALMASGHLAYRSFVQMVVSIFYVILCLILVPNYSWHGAVYATYLCEVTIIVIYFVTIWALVRSGGSGATD